MSPAQRPARHRALPLIGAELVRLTERQIPRAGSSTDARGAFVDLANQLRSHLAKEENLLFPAIEALARAEREGSGRPILAFSTVLHPIRLMETEHARIEVAMMWPVLSKSTTGWFRRNDRSLLPEHSADGSDSADTLH